MSIGFKGKKSEEMEVERRGKCEAVQSIEDTAVPGNKPRCILDAKISLYRRERHVSCKAGEWQRDGDRPKSDPAQRRRKKVRLGR